MRSFGRLLFGLAGLLGVGVVVLPALAASSEAKIEVAENCNNVAKWQCWTAPGANKPATVQIAVGGVVTFTDMTQFAANITWKGAAPVCSTNVPVSPTPAATGWEGTCRFDAPGTYQFEDPSMFYPKATVEVLGTTTTATTTTTSTSTSGTTTTSSGSGSGSGSGSAAPTAGGGEPGNATGSLLAGSAFSAVALGSAQHGQAVRGSIDVSQTAAGGRLEVTLLARKASLASTGHAAQLQVGRVMRSLTRAGKVTFAVALDVKARRALHLHRRLAVSVKIVLSPAHGSALTITRSVLLRD